VMPGQARPARQANARTRHESRHSGVARKPAGSGAIVRTWCEVRQASVGI
jgi:hypothetical protein